MNLKSNFPLRADNFDPVLLMLKIMSKKKLTPKLYECFQRVSPEILYNLVKYSNPDTWFAASIYEEVLKRYETISYILSTEDNSQLAEKIISICMELWMELRPFNNENLKVTSDVLRKGFNFRKRICLVSLTCPAYTLGREGIAENLIQNRINFFADLVSKSIGLIKDLISEWHIYVWDPSGLNDPILRKTIHPKLLRNSDLEAQLNRNWALFCEIAEMIRSRLKIKIVLKKYVDLQKEIYLAKDILESLENRENFLSKCIERILMQGKEDYKIMGEDIREHRDRFWNDSFIYTGAILRYGMKNNSSKNLSMMISIESRIHHIAGLRLYHFQSGNKTYLMPVWNYPTWIRSFYWVNKGKEDIEQEILASLKRWKNHETWKDFLAQRALKIL
jgi:hypothetical protein